METRLDVADLKRRIAPQPHVGDRAIHLHVGSTALVGADKELPGTRLGHIDNSGLERAAKHILEHVAGVGTNFSEHLLLPSRGESRIGPERRAERHLSPANLYRLDQRGAHRLAGRWRRVLQNGLEIPQRVAWHLEDVEVRTVDDEPIDDDVAAD